MNQPLSIFLLFTNFQKLANIHTILTITNGDEQTGASTEIGGIITTIDVMDIKDALLLSYPCLIEQANEIGNLRQWPIKTVLINTSCTSFIYLLFAQFFNIFELKNKVELTTSVRSFIVTTLLAACPCYGRPHAIRFPPELKISLEPPNK